MKILVPCKRVPDPDHRIRVTADGQDIERDSTPFVINPFDAIAVEEAIRIRESRSELVSVIAVGIGDDAYEKELRTALAMGADRALRINAPARLDPWNVARVLEAVVRRDGPELVLLGKQAVDDDFGQTGQFLAARLDWPQATFASRIEFLPMGGLRVTRETDHGLEIVRFALPAVITVDLRLNEPRYASLPSILRARGKPIETVTLDELDVRLEPRVAVRQLEASSSQRRCQRVEDVSELVERLKDETRVLGK